ncbi:dockerin type I repeat-containing protein [Ruminococcus callidus]|uniref:dockerin type I repeat-containing protein n=1 Tax=Ruminococcus callidus TaxID=40519 RepID=UPI00351FDF98
MKRRTRIISAVCAAALLGSAMTMPAAAYPMHMNGEAEVPLAQVLQMLENDKTAYVEKGESMYYGLKDPTPVGMYDNIFYATAEQDDLIQLNEYAYRIQLEQDVADVRELTEQLCGLLTKKENAEEPTADQALSTEESETRQLTMTAEGSGAYTLRFSTSSYRLDEEKLCQFLQTLSGFVSVQQEVWGVSLKKNNVAPMWDGQKSSGICCVTLKEGATLTPEDLDLDFDVEIEQNEKGTGTIIPKKSLDMQQRYQLLRKVSLMVEAGEKIDQVGVTYAIYESALNTAAESDGSIQLMGRGDCDGSKELDSSDVFELLQHTANVGAGNEGTLTGKGLLAADIDGNGVVDSTDVFELLRYCAEKGAGLQPTWTELLG